MERVNVVGGGLAGSEAAWTLARLGVPVRLWEMRPKRMTPAHATGGLAEIVCSNSLGGEGPTNAKGLLQAEMRQAGSLILEAAERARVPAGGALAVDREEFSRYITERLTGHPLVEVVREEVAEIPSGITLLATGPLTSDALSEAIKRRFGDHFLAYYDAASPIVLHEGIDLTKCFRAGRYAQEADYLNCPLTEEEYRRFYQALLEAQRHTPHEWENLQYFEACVPVEELARRGYGTLLFGPMKPVGLKDPRTGKEPFAVVQLRQEDKAGRMWSLVGFQTGLRWPEQRRLIQMIPGLENAEIVRYGVMHRNTYLNAPLLLRETLEFREAPGLFAAGVLAGVEGYLESAATGFLAGLNAARRALGLPSVVPPEESLLGGLVRFLATANPENFQPMNANWGLVPPVEGRLGKREKREAMYRRGLLAFARWLQALEPPLPGARPLAQVAQGA
ncbi:methylenetetrahydrofolate--tRNA-(uracil(54)-C(5))-methyltransferase (FADH(2)-oxidizing) TrmFO [Thermus thermamylovorans]|uniref:Methylenetetrahydrofolate--tRNA-(uracil-5-)-methyltransferase TrmFO n=1 Tax=Thermus thermamylovorans TaxID=2509362 RepID=A0A4Q9B445_9DEIN|nr:methylenetetrahydrofolate--tRNA-(uracil(54)-C(5))-methyltransferase (FADH(2)-oxidizing) TrmFO [Thermus thermamylovorans]TBH20700.1 methylenetetrahydrofolate--tRNA-(uracil(54)-C(5))-methyltransferase (FADH(2)-oxidizing) TrmFO [Thermus thermamylovorans]